MDRPIPFLVGTGQIPERNMRAASLELSRVWGGVFLNHCSGEDPHKVLKSIRRGNGLAQLTGDPASENFFGGSWLEALAAWRQPTILMCSPSLSGDIPGNAAAYVALCSVLSVPLVGIIQISGKWEPLRRRADGLPWCGWLPGDQSVNNQNEESFFGFANTSDVATLLKIRLMQIKP